MRAENVRKFENWLRGLPFPLGGMQGEGAMPMWHSVPESIEILPCGCSRRQKWFGFWCIEVVMANELKVQTTYHKEVLCGTCHKRLN